MRTPKKLFFDAGDAGIVLPSTQLVYDSFNGTLSTEVNLRSPDVDVVGGGWNYNGGTTSMIFAQEVQPFGNSADNVARTDGGSGQNNYIWIESNQSDVIISADVLATNQSGDTWAGVVFRSDTVNSNYLTVSFRKSTSTFRMRFDRSTAGVKTLIEEVAVAHTYGTIKIVAIGNQVSIYHDGVLWKTFTESHQQNGTRHGLTTLQSVGTRQYDNFEVLG